MSFDELIDRTGTKSRRWEGRGDTLALTIGDSDFRLPPPIREALIRRLDEGVIGYDGPPESLRHLIIDRMNRLYGWEIRDEWLMFIPGVVPGFNFCCRGLTNPGDAIITETPIYYPFLGAPANAGRALSLLPALPQSDRWDMDLEKLASLASEPRNKLLLFCNPQNPLGRVSTRDELMAMAEICLREQVPIVSDEIHCDLLYDGRNHIPVASLSPEIADNTITLMATTKAYGISGIGGAFAVIPNPDLKKKVAQATAGLNSGLNALAMTAMEAAYADCNDWLAEEVQYLETSRDYLCGELQSMPGVSLVKPEATYFLWFDVSETGLNDPHGSFLDAGVELSEGGKFGDQNFLRLNFASPKNRLENAVSRMWVKLSR